jgi:hypothetical protein
MSRFVNVPRAGDGRRGRRAIAPIVAMVLGGSLVALGTTALPAGAATPAFGLARPVHYPTGSAPSAVAIGDLSGDGVADLATADGGSTVSVHVGLPGGGFLGAQSHPTAFDARGVVIGDLDGDTEPDLAVATTNGVSVLLNTGDGVMGAATTYLPTGSYFSMALADLDGDDALDLVLADYYSSRVSVLLGTGAGTFGPVTHATVPSGAFAVAVGDLDADGVPDLATVSYGVPGKVSVLLGTGSGGFGAAQAYSVGSLPYSVAIGDLDDDGIPDLAVTNAGSSSQNGSVSVLLGDGDGTFGPTTAIAVGPQPSSVAIADLNGDTFLDLAVANRNGSLIGIGTGSLSVVLSNGDGTFDPSASTAVGAYANGVAVGDLDGDARPDVAVANSSDSGRVSVLANSTGTPGFAVTPTTDLVDGQSVVVEGYGWQPGHSIGVCQGLPLEPAGPGSCANGAYVLVAADGFGNFSVAVTVRAVITVPDQGVPVSCIAASPPCVIGVADAGDIAGTAQTVPVSFVEAVPGAPTIGTAVPGDESATVSWTPPVADGGLPISTYVVTPYIGFSPQPSQTVPAPATSAVVTGLTNATEYRFRVQAVNSLGTGPFSTATNAVYPAPDGSTLPGAPTIHLDASAGDGEATVSWSAPTDDGGSPISGYRVTPYVGFTPQPPQTFASPSTTQVVTGLTNGVTYRFRVQALNSVGPGAFSTASNPVTPASVPGAPSIGTAVAGNGQATVSWTPPTSNGGLSITGYVVTPYIGAVAQPPAAAPASATSVVVTGLVNGTTYTFRVAATNALGTSAESSASNAVTPHPTAPGAPTIGGATAGNGVATVTWTAPVNDGGSPIIGYIVTPYIGFVSQGPRYFTSTATEQTVTGLTNGTRYRFRVRAWSAIGVSGFSTVTNPVTPMP